MKYDRFENIPVWVQARRFVGIIYKVCNNVSFNKDFELLSQIRRASTSIMLNIAEGFERRSNKDFARFINTAKASAGELRCALYIALDIGYLTKEIFDSLYTEITSISNQCAKYEQYLLETDFSIKKNRNKLEKNNLVIAKRF